MNSATVPVWAESLDSEDLLFIKNFILSSGSLKQTAESYGITYPTVRFRLDRVIQKIRERESEDSASYVSLIRRLALDGKIDLETAKLLIEEYVSRRQAETAAEPTK